MIEMQNSGESTCHPPYTQNESFIKSPISKSFDLGIDTPQKLPAAPHPSPINMDTDSCNPKSKEIFRTELLKACLLKIPEAVASESVFNDYLSTRPSSTCEDPIPDLADGPQRLLLRPYKKANLEYDWFVENEIPTDPHTISNVKDSPVDFNPRQYTKLFENANLEYSPDKSTSAESECIRNLNSFRFGNNGKFELPYINVSNVDSVNGENGAEQFYNHATNRVAFNHNATNHQEMLHLFNINSEKIEHSESMFGDISPCSDNISTVAVCASDASDISDEDLCTKSMDLGDMERSTVRPLNSSNKKSRSTMRSFLNWRRSLKFRKRAASLDENKFPFLANRFDSYKTEFELSV